MIDFLVVRIGLLDSDMGVATEVANALVRHGFEVIRVSERGVEAISDKKTIEEFFEAKITMFPTQQFLGDLNYDKLPLNQDYRVYFPRSPTLF